MTTCYHVNDKIQGDKSNLKSPNKDFPNKALFSGFSLILAEYNKVISYYQRIWIMAKVIQKKIIVVNIFIIK